MNAFDRLNEYLARLERRLRIGTILKGLAVLGGVALGATVALVLFTNAFAFSSGSLTGARVVLFLALAFALGFGLLLPLMRLNRRAAARKAEGAFPEFEERLLTFAESDRKPVSKPFLELLADDALPVARAAEPARIVTAGHIGAFLAAAGATVGVLVWLTLAGPGFLGYGSSLLWAGAPRGRAAPYYDIQVTPGNKTVRRGADLLITANLLGFQSESVRLYARFASSSKWEEVRMQGRPGGAGHEFLFAGIPEPFDYYVEAGAVRTGQFRIDVIDLPKVERIRVTYNFPEWASRAPLVEEDGGDLRAVTGTEAELEIHTDKPVRGGRLILDDGSEIVLSAGNGNTATARVPIQKDGLYHVAVLESGEKVRLTEDYFIEAQQESPPTVRVRRPGRDYRASPIEEVTIEVQAEDDYGLRDVALHYSVNGGPDKTVKLLERRGAKESDGTTVLYLEDHNLVPGDIVSLYAEAADALTTERTGFFFIEAQPFERAYSQSQQSGGGGGQNGDQNRISPRQKEIIAATWNIIRERKRGGAVNDEGAFLSEVQTKLKEQAESLARRMKARQLASANEEFQQFSNNMESAAAAMGEAAEQLTGQKWQEALQPEQKALQHLLRAEAVFREIQVARGSRGGGAGGNMGRDLESLFDLELDTEKNQYETGQSAAAAARRAKEIDEALQRLADLARRQQELAARQRRSQQNFQQRWQQEMLRREAEELRRQMEQLARQNSSQPSPQAGRQSRQQGQASGQQGRQSRQQNQMSRQSSYPQISENRLRQAIEHLREATEDMRRASNARRPGSDRESDSQRAAQRLRDATEMLDRMQRKQASESLAGIAERAQQLAEQQRKFAGRLRELYKDHQAVSGKRTDQTAPPPDPRRVLQLAEEKRRMSEDLHRLESEMQSAVRDLAASEKSASSKLREALGEMQKRELSLRMKYLSEWIRRGLGPYAWLREAPVTEGMDRLAEQTREAQNAIGRNSRQQEGLESALSRVERLRGELERMARPQRATQGNPAQQGHPGGQPGNSGAQGSNQQGQMAGLAAGRQVAMPAPGPGQPAGGEGRSFSAMNLGDRSFRAPERPLSPQQLRAIEQTYRQGLRDLSQLRGELRGQGEISSDVAELIRQMQRLDPSRFPGNPELVDRLRTQVLPGLEEVELRLRRRLHEEGQGQVKSMLSVPTPPGYAEAAAEYYRKLSRGR